MVCCCSCGWMWKWMILSLKTDANDLLKVVDKDLELSFVLRKKEKWFFLVSPISVNHSNICFDHFRNPEALTSLCSFLNRLRCEDSSLLIRVLTVPWCSWWAWPGWWSWPPHWSALVSPPVVRACVGGFKVTDGTSDPTSYSSWQMTRMWSWVSIPDAIHH